MLTTYDLHWAVETHQYEQYSITCTIVHMEQSYLRWPHVYLERKNAILLCSLTKPSDIEVIWIIYFVTGSCNKGSRTFVMVNRTFGGQIS